MIIYPDNLKQGSVIGTTATSDGLYDKRDLNKLEHAIENLKDLGYKILETDNVRKIDETSISSSSGETRAKEFLELYSNSEVDLIISTRGGEFLMEMLPFLDKEEEKILNSKPTWVQGYSDTSLLLYYLTTKYNLATIHSVNFTEYCMNSLQKSQLVPLEAINKKADFIQENYPLYEVENIRRQDGGELEEYYLTEEVEYKHLNGKKEDKIIGRVLGGCIDTLRTLLGTKYDNTNKFINEYKEEGILWYLENCELKLPDLYRTLWQMKEVRMV